MSDLFTRTGSKLVIKLHPGQTQAWDSQRRHIFIIAGTQSGKTSFVPVWLEREIREKGNGDYLAVTATYDLFKLKFLPEMKRFFCEIFGWGYSASERVLFKAYKPRLFDRIIMRSADAEGGLESATAKGAILDECGQDRFTLSAYEAVLRRLSLSQGRLLGGTTPYNLGWLKTQIFDKWRAGDKDIQVIQFKSTMNPAFPMEEYVRAKRTLPSWKFEMFYNGNFSRPAGLIYEDFSEICIVPSFDVPADWPRFLGVDFGAVNTAKVWVAQDPKSKLYYVYRESLDGNMTTKDHAAKVLQYNERNLRVWGGAKSETQQRMDWRSAGVYVQEPKIADVEAGIDRIQELIKQSKMYVMSHCTGIIDEFGTYSRDLDENGQPTIKIRNKNEYHRLDALRYLGSGLTAGSTILFGA